MSSNENITRIMTSKKASVRAIRPTLLSMRYHIDDIDDIDYIES